MKIKISNNLQRGFSSTETFIILAVIVIIITVVFQITSNLREKASDVAIRYGFSDVQISAKTLKQKGVNGYEFCDSQEFQKVIEDTSINAETRCKSNANSWALIAKLAKTDEYYCVDSFGVETTVSDPSLIKNGSCGDTSQIKKISDNSQLVKAETEISVKSCTEEGMCNMFLTSETFNGNIGGLSRADEICSNDKRNPKDGVYKALLASKERNIGGNDWVLASGQEYYKLDNETLIGETDANAWFVQDLPLENGGTMSGLDEGLFDYSCNDWQNDEKAECSLPKRFYCVEQ